jgi:hypothetical protein
MLTAMPSPLVRPSGIMVIKHTQTSNLTNLASICSYHALSPPLPGMCSQHLGSAGAGARQARITPLDR